ncbi:MAG: response regulator [Methanosarcinales archaeon]|nr:MAG: response regulator [Methanosarcinales archaeon]
MREAKILIVEDEAVVAENLAMVITDGGYDVVGRADSADAAVNAASELNPDLILMDIVLSGQKNGIDASHEIKEKFDIPVIFLTAYSDLKLVDKAKSTEPYAYIVKPFQEGQLFASIEMALYKSQIEKKLKESEAKFRDLTELLPQTVFETDEQGNLTFANHAGFNCFNYTRDDFDEGLTVIQMISSEDRDRAKKNIEKVIKGEHLHDIEYLMRRKDGSTFSAIIYSTPIIHENKHVGLRGVLIDITGRKQAEKRIKDEYRRAEFYIDLMSHDINNASQVASGYLDLLLQTPEFPTKFRKHVEIALNHVKKSANIISDVKTLSELQSGEAELARIDIYPALASAVETAISQPANVEINSDITEGRYFIHGNTMLFSIFSNLLTNAVKFDQHKIVKIDVNISPSDDDRYWKLEVKDRGRGIGDHYKEIIFNRLERAGESAQGTGLGLTIVKYIVESYGGSIKVEDRVSGDRTMGSNFVMRLPKGV